MNTITSSNQRNNQVLRFVCTLERYIVTFDIENENIELTNDYKNCLRKVVLEMYNNFFIGKHYIKSPVNPLRYYYHNNNTKIEAMFFENLGFKFLLEDKQDTYFYKSDNILDEAING